MKYPLIILVGILILTLVLPGINAEVTYTPTTSTICNNGVCTQTIYSGTQFVYEDNVWKDYTEARSLKDKGFEVNVLEDDKDYPLEVVDFNATSITVKLNPKGLSVFSNEVPVRIWDVKDEYSSLLDFKNTYEKLKEEKLGFHLLNQEETKTYDFGLGKILEFGMNSTTIILKTADTENLDDAGIHQDQPTTYFGGYTVMNLKSLEGETRNNLIKFNNNVIPRYQNITSVILSLRLMTNPLSAGESFSVSVNPVHSDYIWDEASVNWNARPTVTDFDNTNESIVSFSPATPSNAWYNWSVTNIIKNDYNNNNNSTIYLISYNGVGIDSGGTTDRLEINSKENITHSPKLYVTYEIYPLIVNITFPTNNTFYNYNPTYFNWTLDNSTTMNTCKYSLNGASNISVGCTTTSKYITSLSNSINNIILWVNDSAGSVSSSFVTYTTDLINPSVSIDVPGALIDFGKPGGDFQLNWTISDTNLANCSYFYNGTNKTVTCTNNGYSIPLVKGWNNITMYANDSAGHLGSDIQLFNYKVFQNSISYNSTTYETMTDNYYLNISSDGSQLVTAKLYYNGTEYTSTKTGNNVEMLFTNIITHADGNAGNKSFYWNVTYGSDVIKVDTSYQLIQNFSLNLCNGTNGMTYINFTFKDEATDGYINSTFEIDGSGWQYYLGSDSSVYKTLNYNQQTNKSNYAFCLYNSNQTIHSNSVTFRYDLPGYPERLHTRSSDLTNTTTNVILYLLSTSDGIYSSFQVQDTNGAPISDVSVQLERQINGVWTVIGLDETDNSGLVTFFVNPNQDHRITFSKTGYTSQILIIRPTQSLYTVVLSGGITEPIYSPDYLGINYKIAPNPGVVLTPGTVYGFTFNITANLSNLVSYSFNLYDEDNNLLDSDNGITTEGSNLTIYLNTSTYESIIGKYYINIGNETQQITLRTWTVLQINAGNYSISTWFTNLDMSDVDVKGKFTGYFIFFLILFVGVAGLTKLTGMELASPGIALGLVLAIAWIASLGGFFNITFSPSDFINKYGVVLVITMMCAGFTLGQLRKT